MQVGIKLVGYEQASARLQAIGRAVEPVVRGALNTTAGQARTQRYIKPMRSLFRASVLGARLGNADLRGKLALKRANSKRLNARIIPSSAGVRVDDYRRWVFEIITPTRARIHVYGLGGRKLAAGFVNPSGRQQAPLSTRSRKVSAKGREYQNKRAIGAALGPSAAYWFRRLTDGQTLRWVNARLQQEFARRMRKELNR